VVGCSKERGFLSPEGEWLGGMELVFRGNLSEVAAWVVRRGCPVAASNRSLLGAWSGGDAWVWQVLGVPEPPISLPLDRSVITSVAT